MPKLDKNVFLFAGLLPAVIVALDQATKYWATKFLNLPFDICEQNPNIGREGIIREFSPIFDIAMTCNQGVSFGIMGGDSDLKRWALTLFALGMSGVLAYALTQTKDIISRIGIGLVIGGALGNGIDRLFFGAVTDFVSVEQLVPFFGWVFNLADSAITCGVIILLIGSFFPKAGRRKDIRLKFCHLAKAKAFAMNSATRSRHPCVT